MKIAKLLILTSTLTASSFVFGGQKNPSQNDKESHHLLQKYRDSRSLYLEAVNQALTEDPSFLSFVQNEAKSSMGAVGERSFKIMINRMGPSFLNLVDQVHQASEDKDPELTVRLALAQLKNPSEKTNPAMVKVAYWALEHWLYSHLPRN